MWSSKDEEILQLWLQLGTVLRDRSVCTYSSFVSRDSEHKHIWNYILFIE